MKISINNKKCLGCGSCAAVSPDYFEINFDRGKAAIKKQPKNLSKVKEAIEICPTEAIIAKEN
ncbi:MAG: ferredoxin [Candidatus Shapirobacteria bacterium]